MCPTWLPVGGILRCVTVCDRTSASTVPPHAHAGGARVWQVSDHASVVFSRNFYHALLCGKTVKQAFDIGIVCAWVVFVASPPSTSLTSFALLLTGCRASAARLPPYHGCKGPFHRRPCVHYYTLDAC